MRIMEPELHAQDKVNAFASWRQHVGMVGHQNGQRGFLVLMGARARGWRHYCLKPASLEHLTRMHSAL